MTDVFNSIDEFVVLDIETSGLDSTTDKIIEVGAVKVKSGKIVERYHTLINPGLLVSKEVEEITGIDNESLQKAKKYEDLHPELRSFIGGHTVVTCYAKYIFFFLQSETQSFDAPWENNYVDISLLSKQLNPTLKKHNLPILIEYYKLNDYNRVTAMHSAEIIAQIFLKMKKAIPYYKRRKKIRCK